MLDADDVLHENARLPYGTLVILMHWRSSKS